MLDTGEVGEGPVVESSVELAVHKVAGRVEDFPGPVVPEENAAVLEILEKNGAFDEVADNSVEETREIRAGEARKALAGEGGVADNSVGEAREVRAEETRKVRETGENFSSKY